MKARRNPDEDNAPVQRSRFADALRIAEATSAARFASTTTAPSTTEVSTELGRQIEDMRNMINQAPEFHYDRALLEEVDRSEAEREAALGIAEAEVEAEAAVADTVDEIEAAASDAVESVEAFIEEAADKVEATVASAIDDAKEVIADAVDEIEAPAEPEGVVLGVIDEAAADVAAVEQDVAETVEAAAEKVEAFAQDLPDIAELVEQIEDVAVEAAENVEVAYDELGETISMPALDLKKAIPALKAIPRVDLPTIGESDSDAKAEKQGTASRSTLRTTLPSITGSISYGGGSLLAVQEAQAEAEELTVPELKGSPVLDADMLPSFDALADAEGVAELVDSIDEDAAVDEVDEFAFDGVFDEQDDYADQDYFEEPKKEGIFSKLFKRNKKQDAFAVSTHEWLDVDEDYTAREVGAARGSWESFKSDDFDDYDDFAGADDADNVKRASAGSAEARFKEPAAPVEDSPEGTLFDDDDWSSEDWNNSGWGRGWNGGAFSGLKQKLSSTIHRGKKDEELPEEGAIIDEEIPYDAEFEPHAYESAAYDEKPEPEYTRPRKRRQPRQSISTMRNLDLDTEVWFVALGSQYSGNAGMKAFLAAHERELHGALVVELDGLGAGDLSYVKKEGVGQPVEASRRALRFLKKAQNITGLKLGSEDIQWTESASSLAIRHGISALHLIGAAQGKQAYRGEEADTIDIIDLDVLAENTDFVMELLKTI